MKFDEAKLCVAEIKSANHKTTDELIAAADELFNIPELNWPASLCEEFLDLLLDAHKAVKGISVAIDDEVNHLLHQSFLVQHSKAGVEMMVAGTNAMHRPLLETLYHLVNAPQYYCRLRVLNKKRGIPFDDDATAATVVKSHMEYLEHFISQESRRFRNRLDKLTQSSQQFETDDHKSKLDSES